MTAVPNIEISSRDEATKAATPASTLGDEIAVLSGLLFTVGLALDSIISTSKHPEYHHTSASRASTALDRAFVQLRHVSLRFSEG